MKSKAKAVFSDDGTVSIVTLKRGFLRRDKWQSIKFNSVSRAVNYCKDHNIDAEMVHESEFCINA